MLFLLIVIILVVGVACVVLANWIYDRQKAEIESLNNALDEQCDACSCVLLDERDNARAEAIKEFAERLKHIIGFDDLVPTDCVILFPYIDTLVKEMTEGK